MLHYNNNRRKTTEKRLNVIFNILTLSVLVTLTHAAATDRANEFHSKCPEKCYTDTCGDEALHFIKLMDDTVDPCDNFYDFVCGTYTRDVPIEEGGNAASIVQTFQTGISAVAFRDVSAEIKEDDSEAIKKMKTYYQNCIDERKIEQIGTKPLLKILDSIGGWPVVERDRWDTKYRQNYDFMQTIYKIIELKGPQFFPVIMDSEIDNINSTMHSIKLGNALMNVDASWFADDDNHNSDGRRVMRPFYNMLLQVALKLGAKNDNRTLNELMQITDFEIKLYRCATPPEKLVDLPVEKSRITIRDLSRKHPSIPWLEFINKLLSPSGISANENEYVYVIDPDFVSKLIQLLDMTSPRLLANFIAWKVIQKSLPFMPKDLRSATTEYENTLQGTSGENEKASLCFNEVQEAFPVAMSAMYVKNHFREPVQRPVNEMFQMIKYAARKNLQENNWMDEVTKRIALEKLDAMNVTVGCAEELMDERKVDEYYRGLEVNPGSYMESGYNVSSFNDRVSIGKLRKTTTENSWSAKPSVVELNAYMSFQENHIELPAAFLTSVYGLKKPQYINYGMAGAFIGHELFHGYDNQGKQYDKYGNQVNWWQPETEEKFKQKSQCFIEQYGNFTDPIANMNINGELTLGENIADNGGFKIAYLAYNEWLKRHNTVEGCLPSINYTPKQMFWVSSASVWCANERPDYVRSTLTTDNHSSNMARVLITFSNLKEFIDDFKCRPGSRMNPHKKCQIW